MNLRPYQIETLERCRQAYREGAKRVILQASTGAGKTAMASVVCRNATARGSRVLYVVHREEILQQTQKALAPLPVSLLVAGGRAEAIKPGSILLASAQTLARREVPEHDLLVWDESHCFHSAQIRVQAACPARALLLTATPARTDGKPLADIADAIVQGPVMADLIAAGYLVPALVYGAPSPDMHEVPIRGGEFLAGPAEQAAPRLVGSVPDAWLRHAKGRRTVLFASGVTHSRECVAALTMAGVRAVHVDGETPTAERAEAFAAMRRHDLDVLCNVGIAVEGLDIPEISAVYWARATASLAVYLQGTGRGMRPSAGKTDLIVIDGGGNAYRHGLPEEPREWTLAGRVKRTAEAGLRTCAACLAVYAPTVPACPRCGAEPTPEQRRAVQSVGGELVRLTAAEVGRREKAQSAATGPRPCPIWAAADAELWTRLERKRQKEGYALGDGSRAHPGWTAVQWDRIRRQRR
jgi:superfamily II DNA or RNA helicase